LSRSASELFLGIEEDLAHYQDDKPDFEATVIPVMLPDNLCPSIKTQDGKDEKTRVRRHWRGVRSPRQSLPVHQDQRWERRKNKGAAELAGRAMSSAGILADHHVAL
jgi:hypothetical protein